MPATSLRPNVNRDKSMSTPANIPNCKGSTPFPLPYCQNSKDRNAMKLFDALFGRKEKADSKPMQQEEKATAKVDSPAPQQPAAQPFYSLADNFERLRKLSERSEERRVGKECRSRWSPY